MREMNELTAAKSEYESLKEELRRLRAEISVLTALRDELKLRECPRIQAEYNARIGALEFRVFEAHGRVLELRRAIEILQASRNRQEKKTGTEAEDEARGEFERYEEYLRRKAEELKHAREFREREEAGERRWRSENGQNTGNPRDDGDDMYGGQMQGNGTSPDDTEAAGDVQDGSAGTADNLGAGQSADNEAAGNGTGQGDAATGARTFRSRNEELRYYYHVLIKRLHPDCNPDETPEELELFRQAVRAYENADLEKLKEIYNTLKARQPEKAFRDTPEDVVEMKKLAAAQKAKKQALEKEIHMIRNTYPYKWKKLLENEEALAARQRELANQLSAYEKQYEDLRVRFERLKRGRQPV